MKLYYIASDGTKTLLGEGESLQDLLPILEKDANKKFYNLRDVKVGTLENGKNYSNESGVTGYQIEK